MHYAGEVEDVIIGRLAACQSLCQKLECLIVVSKKKLKMLKSSPLCFFVDTL